MHMAVHPVIRTFEPDFAVALPSPTRGGRGKDLIIFIKFQVFTRRCKLYGILVILHLSCQKVKPLRAFIPPVAEKFRVIRRYYQRKPVAHLSGQMLYLFLPVEHEIAGLIRGAVSRGLRNIRLFMAGSSCYLIIFYAGIYPGAVGVYIRAYVIVIEIKADITVELPVIVIARIPLYRAPDSLGRFRIPAENRRSIPGKIRAEYAEPLKPVCPVIKTRLPFQNLVSIILFLP